MGSVERMTVHSYSSVCLWPFRVRLVAVLAGERKRPKKWRCKSLIITHISTPIISELWNSVCLCWIFLSNPPHGMVRSNTAALNTTQINHRFYACDNRLKIVKWRGVILTHSSILLLNSDFTITSVAAGQCRRRLNGQMRPVRSFQVWHACLDAISSVEAARWHPSTAKTWENF